MNPSATFLRVLAKVEAISFIFLMTAAVLKRVLREEVVAKSVEVVQGVGQEVGQGVAQEVGQGVAQVAVSEVPATAIEITAKYLGWAHGVLFVWFCVVLIMVSLRLSWPRWRTAKVFIASLLPFGPFIIDRGLVAEIAADAKEVQE